MIFTMLVVVVLAVGIIAVVAVGLQGAGRDRAPEVADVLQTTARHLNGEGEPPRALVALFDEIDEVPELNVREIPQRLRTLRSARTAASAPSASVEPQEVLGPDADDDLVARVEAVRLQQLQGRVTEALDAPFAEDEAFDPYGLGETTRQ